jgi:hypothetical protein
MRKASQLAGKPGDASSVSTSTDLNRRRFLFALGTTSAGAVAAPALAAVPEAATPSAEADKTSGYRETEHVRDYYASARI